MQVPVKENGAEIVNYNNPEVPIYIRHGILSLYDGYHAVSHWHEDIEFIYIQKGSMNYHINETIVILKEGDGIFINSRQLHYGFSKNNQECIFFCILIHPSFLSPNNYISKHFVTPLLTDAAYPFVLLKKDSSWQSDLLNLLIQTSFLEDKEDSEYAMLLNSLSIFQMLYKHLPLSHEKSHSHEQALLIVKKMIRFIQKNYESKVTLEQIAISGNISKSQCGILFQKHTGHSPIEYLTEYRLQIAKYLLTTTDMSVVQIALEIGFSNSSYFCETFRKKNGITPLDYRKTVINS